MPSTLSPPDLECPPPTSSPPSSATFPIHVIEPRWRTPATAVSSHSLLPLSARRRPRPRLLTPSRSCERLLAVPVSPDRALPSLTRALGAHRRIPALRVATFAHGRCNHLLVVARRLLLLPGSALCAANDPHCLPLSHCSPCSLCPCADAALSWAASHRRPTHGLAAQYCGSAASTPPWTRSSPAPAPAWPLPHCSLSSLRL